MLFCAHAEQYGIAYGEQNGLPYGELHAFLQSSLYHTCVGLERQQPNLPDFRLDGDFA